MSVDSASLIEMVFALTLLIASVLLFRKRRGVSLLFLFAGTLILGYSVAMLDPFLNLWDEQFHALVAKNMMNSPLEPKLYREALLSYDHRNWSGNYIWVHKQPLFLWQIALSLKLFGVSTLSVRLPSIIMHAILPLMVYRIGKISLNDRIGFVAALIVAVAHFPLEIMAGKYSTDHNDMAFLFYVTASFWSFWEYKRSGNKSWLILTGVLSGGAVLVKWLMGLLIYPTWFLSHVIGSSERWNWKSYLPMALTFFISCLVFLPWQIYILNAFPVEAHYEFSMVSKHLYETLEGHGEERFYFFKSGLGLMYGKGDLVPYLLILGVVLAVIKFKNAEARLLYVIPILIVYGVYTFAETKMPAFPMVVFPFGAVAIASVLFAFYGVLKCYIKLYLVRTISGILALVGVLILMFDYNRIKENHFPDEWWSGNERKKELKELSFFEKWQHRGQQESTVVFLDSFTFASHVPMMFYTNCTAYSIVPSQDDVIYLQNKNRRVVVISEKNDSFEEVSGVDYVKVLDK